MDDTILVVMILSVPVGAISLLILVGKAIARKINRPQIVDPDPPPVLRRSYSAYINAILVILVIMGAISFPIVYMYGSAIAGP